MLDRDMTTTVCTDSELSMRFLTDASWDIWWKFDEYEAYKELLTKKPWIKNISRKSKTTKHMSNYGMDQTIRII